MINMSHKLILYAMDIGKASSQIWLKQGLCWWWIDCISWEPIPSDKLGYDLPEMELTGPRYVEGHEEEIYEGEEEPADHRRNSFINIYNNDWWFSNVSKSGTGSELTQTVHMEMVLDKVVEMLKESLGKDVIRWHEVTHLIHSKSNGYSPAYLILHAVIWTGCNTSWGTEQI